MGIIRGYEKLGELCGNASKPTLKNWIKNYKMPVVRINNMVCGIEEEILTWFSELRKKSEPDKKYSKLSSNFYQRLRKL